MTPAWPAGGGIGGGIGATSEHRMQVASVEAWALNGDLDHLVDT